MAIITMTPELQAQIDAVTSTDGLVYIKYKYSQARLVIQGDTYDFTKRKGYCLGKVKSEHVLLVLNSLGGCCGQRKPNVYSMPSPKEVEIWDSYQKNL